VVVDKFCSVKISVVIVGSTKRDEYTTDDIFWPTEVTGVVLGVPKDGSVVEMLLEKDSAVETSRVDFENVEGIAVDISIVLSVVKVDVEF
jgi:hypothetical protein